MGKTPPPHPTRPSGPQKKNHWIYVEDALIILALPVLWLTIFRLEGLVFDVIEYVTLAAMVVVFVRRIRRFGGSK